MEDWVRNLAVLDVGVSAANSIENIEFSLALGPVVPRRALGDTEIVNIPSGDVVGEA